MDALPVCHSVVQLFLSATRNVTALIAASVTQLTLCQVSTEEIEAATKLLAKAAANYGMSQKFWLTDLDTAMRQLHQLIRSLHSCTTSASYEVSEAQKALLLFATQRNALVLLLRSTTHCKPLQLTLTSCKSTSQELLEKMTMLGKDQLSGL